MPALVPAADARAVAPARAHLTTIFSGMSWPVRRAVTGRDEGIGCGCDGRGPVAGHELLLFFAPLIAI